MIHIIMMDHLMTMASSQVYVLTPEQQWTCWRASTQPGSDYMGEDFRDMQAREFNFCWFQLESNFCGSEQTVSGDFTSPLLAAKWKRDFFDGSPNPPWCCALPWLCLWATILNGACCTRQSPTSWTCLQQAIGALVPGEVTCAPWEGLAYTSSQLWGGWVRRMDLPYLIWWPPPA